MQNKNKESNTNEYTQNVHHLSETLDTQQKATLALQMLSSEKSKAKKRKEMKTIIVYSIAF